MKEVAHVAFDLIFFCFLASFEAEMTEKFVSAMEVFQITKIECPGEIAPERIDLFFAYPQGTLNKYLLKSLHKMDQHYEAQYNEVLTAAKKLEKLLAPYFNKNNLSRCEK